MMESSETCVRSKQSFHSCAVGDERRSSELLRKAILWLYACSQPSEHYPAIISIAMSLSFFFFSHSLVSCSVCYYFLLHTISRPHVARTVAKV